jgi:transcriptional regulator with XRE-family HTH domain
MTQEQVAVRMGVSVARVSQIERGDVSTQDVLNRYVSALGGTLKLIADFGHPCRDQAEHTTALDLASKIGDKFRQAHSHDGLGHAYRATGNADMASRHWQEALTLYMSLGSPEAEEVRAQLATTGTQVHHQP